MDSQAVAVGALWLQGRLPDVLLETGPVGLLWWQWLALPLLGTVAYAIGRALTWLTLRITRRLASHTSSTWDDQVLLQLRGPMLLGWSLVVTRVLLPLVDLDTQATNGCETLLRVLFIFAMTWAALRVIKVSATVALASPWASQHPGLRSLVPMGSRITSILVLGVVLVSVLAMAGYPVASFIAGLGIGGLAVALAAQKTLENFFGSLAIAADHPFRIGDFVKIGTEVGTVEAIGMRSTRVRTLDRTVITLPNGSLADTRVENYTHRDRFRLHTFLGLTYGTSAAQMRQIRDELEAAIRANDTTWPDSVLVRFAAFGDSSLNIEVMCWFLVPDFAAFQAAREKMLLRFMEIVENGGSGFAFPTRTVHLESQDTGER